MGTNENSILKMQENANSGEENKDLVLNDFLTKEQKLNKNSETEKFETNKSLTEENLGATNLQNTKEFLSYAKKFFEQNPTADTFYEIWTKKEAYTKIDGNGVIEIQKGIDVLSVESHQFQTEKVNEYMLTICERIK